MKSRKVWVIAIAIMNISRVVGSRVRASGIDIIVIEIRFMWIPGIRPVKVPAIIPERRASMRLIIFYKS